VSVMGERKWNLKNMVFPLENATDRLGGLLFEKRAMTGDVRVMHSVDNPQGVHTKVHRIILSTHSQTFESMLTGGFKEGGENPVIKIIGNEHVVTALLEFLYKGVLTKESEETDGRYLWEIAEMYELQGLKNLLLDSMDTNNLFDVLTFGLLGGPSRLEIIERYIKQINPKPRIVNNKS
jgi:hypothetical protein